MVVSLRLHELDRIKPLLENQNKSVVLKKIAPIVCNPKLIQKPERIAYAEFDSVSTLPNHLFSLIQKHKDLLLGLLNNGVIKQYQLNQVVFGCKLGDDSAMIEFVGYDIYIHLNSIEIKLFDGQWYQSMAIRLPNTFNQVLVYVTKYANDHNWRLRIN
jgi:hypothetical protein